jgi:hypothetical protein
MEAALTTVPLLCIVCFVNGAGLQKVSCRRRGGDAGGWKDGGGSHHHPPLVHCLFCEWRWTTGSKLLEERGG